MRIVGIYFLFQKKQGMSTAGNSEFVIGNYRVSKTIGEGTFGKVRLGIHLPTSEKVAVKTLQKQKIAEQADIERVTRQICILKILRHPNIVQLYEIIETKTDIHLIMQYASGGELFDYIVKKKRLDEKEAVGFMQQIFAGVEYIHKIGIVHRDLKPENLLFDEHRRIKIVDFGLSNQYKSGERLKTACGSPCYAAPQMIAGKRYECLGIDIWSCGIILYAMLCGYLPFEDANTNKLYKKIMSGEYEEPKVLTAQSKEMLKAILNVNPDFRFNIQQIKSSLWYKLISEKYEAPGIMVGTDAIIPDDRIIAAMRKMGVTADAAQIKTYVSNNRHNHITSFYYLLKKKAEKSPSLLMTEPKSQNQQRRSTSPLIYKPETKKELFIPSRKPNTAESKESTKVNDSFNASTIVSTLVEANKNKLISNLNQKNQKKVQNFDKYEEFKLFPKHKKTQEEPQSPMTPMEIPINPNPTTKPHSLTSRNDADKATFAFNIDQYRQKARWQGKNQVSFKPQSLTEMIPSKIEDLSQVVVPNLHISEPRVELTEPEEEGYSGAASQGGPQQEQSNPSKNKRREQLSDQLKQISLKIDKQILELRKHNNLTSSMMSQKRRETFTQGMQPPSFKYRAEKTDRSEKSAMLMSENLNSYMKNSFNQGQEVKKEPDLNETSKLSQFREVPTKFPKMHFGPFNVRCLLMEAPRGILLKIEEYLSKLKIVFKEIDMFSIKLSTGEVVSVESIHGISGYHLVKFSLNSPLSESILEALSTQ